MESRTRKLDGIVQNRKNYTVLDGMSQYVRGRLKSKRVSVVNRIFGPEGLTSPAVRLNKVTKGAEQNERIRPQLNCKPQR